MGHGGWGSKIRALPEALGVGSRGSFREVCHREEEDVDVSQKIINSSQAKEKFKDHFFFQISNTRVFQMRGINF